MSSGFERTGGRVVLRVFKFLTALIRLEQRRMADVMGEMF